MKRTATGTLTALLLVTGAAARADPGAALALVQPPPDALLQEAARQLRAELGARGTPVDLVACDAAFDPTCAATSSARAGVVQFFRRADARIGATVVVPDPVHHGARMRRALVDAQQEAAARRLAWDVVELLRAMGIEPHAAVPAAPTRIGSQAPPAPLQDPPQAPGARWRLHLAATGLGSWGGWGLALAPAVRVDRQLGGRLGVRASVTGPGVSATHATSAGSARVREGWAALDAQARGPSWGPVHAAFTAGVGLYGVWVSGRGVAPYADGSAHALSPCAQAAVGLAWTRGRAGSLAVEVGAALATRAPTVTLAGTPVGRGGRPLVALSLAWMVPL